jgi:hypothetical protein
MAELELSQTTTTSMDSEVSDFSISFGKLDEPADTEETYYYNPNWKENLGYYKEIPELKQSIDALARWTAGKGYKTDKRTEIILNLITGWGEDSFDSILQNMIIVKKINGDSYAEVVRRDDGELLNLKPLSPGSIKVVVNKKGIITRYEEIDISTKKSIRKFKPSDIFHLCNDRVSNEIHGVSVIESCKWVIDARNEAMRDWRRILHRNLAGVRIIEVDEEDTAKFNTLKTQWASSIDKGEVLILPKGTAGIPNVPPPINPESWIRYLENVFYQNVGVPKIILGGSQEFTEASSKIGYLTFEQVYMSEQRLLEQDLYSQLAIKIELNRPVSIKEEMEQSEKANTGQVGFQANEIKPNVRRNE